MSDDLIDRLREGEKAVIAAGLPAVSSIYKQAADEIERLRSILRLYMQTYVHTEHNPTPAEEAAVMRAAGEAVGW